MRQVSFKRHRFPPEIIRHAIWFYARFAPRFRDVEERLAERGRLITDLRDLPCALRCYIDNASTASLSA